eukprot:6213200-Pleurochrysis_carterae.AAC.4
MAQQRQATQRCACRDSARVHARARAHGLLRAFEFSTAPCDDRALSACARARVRRKLCARVHLQPRRRVHAESLLHTLATRRVRLLQAGSAQSASCARVWLCTFEAANVERDAHSAARATRRRACREAARAPCDELEQEEIVCGEGALRRRAHNGEHALGRVERDAQNVPAQRQRRPQTTRAGPCITNPQATRFGEKHCTKLKRRAASGRGVRCFRAAQPAASHPPRPARTLPGRAVPAAASAIRHRAPPVVVVAPVAVGSTERERMRYLKRRGLEIYSKKSDRARARHISLCVWCVADKLVKEAAPAFPRSVRAKRRSEGRPRAGDSAPSNRGCRAA